MHLQADYMAVLSVYAFHAQHSIMTGQLLRKMDNVMQCLLYNTVRHESSCSYVQHYSDYLLPYISCSLWYCAASSSCFFLLKASFCSAIHTCQHNVTHSHHTRYDKNDIKILFTETMINMPNGFQSWHALLNCWFKLNFNFWLFWLLLGSLATKKLSKSLSWFNKETITKIGNKNTIMG